MKESQWWADLRLKNYYKGMLMKLKGTGKHRGTDPHTKSLSGTIFKFSKQFLVFYKLNRILIRQLKKRKETASLWSAGTQWQRPLTPALQGGVKAGQGHSGLHRESQDSQSFVERDSVSKEKKQKRRIWDRMQFNGKETAKHG